MPIIKKMVVHKLNLAGDKPEFSEELINLSKLDPEGKAIEFFKEHISNNRTQSATKQCSFDESKAAHVKDSIIAIANAETDEDKDETFIEKSKIITDHFANSIRGKSTSDGSVFILKYTYDSIEYIGILKMDPNLGIQVLEDLTLVVQPNMLPSINERLHKSAFIKLQNKFEDNSVHLFVLDRQQTKDEVAKFFLSDFLQAQEKANDDNLTVIIEKEIKRVICTQITSPELVSDFTIALTKKLTSNEKFDLDIDLPALTNKYISEIAIKESLSRIKGSVTKKYPDAVFQFTPNSEKVRPLEFKSDDNMVTIKVDKNISNDLFSYQVDKETKHAIFKFDPSLNVIPKN